MSDEMMKNIRSSMELKDTDELISIWQNNNHYEWTDEAFAAIREILHERLDELPAQNEPVYDQPSEISKKEETDRATIITTENKMFGKLYAKINGDIQSEEFFTKRHNTLINFANIINILAYIILGITILAVIGDYFNFTYLCHTDYECINHNLIKALLGPSGQEMFLWFTQVLLSLAKGLIFSISLWGISAGLKMIVETDLNYREASEEETIPSDSSPDTIFYSPQSVLKLEKWLDRAVVIGIFTTTLYTIGDFGHYHELIYGYLFSLGQNHPLVILLSILLGLLNIAFYSVVIYFSAKTLIKILQILMQIEMNSRKAK